MKVSEFRKLIREEVKKVLNEGFVAKRGNVNVIKNINSVPIDIVWRKDGYYLEHEIEDSSKAQKATDLLRKVFAEIGPSLQATIVGQPKIYKTSSGFTRFDGPITVVGIKFKTSLSFPEMEKLYPQNTIDRHTD